MDQVVGIHTDAMSTNQAGLQAHEVPLGARRTQHSLRVDVHSIHDQRHFIDEGDVEIAL